MLIACWSPKGGSGTTVMAVALGLALAASETRGALLADLQGDAPAALGLPEPTGLALADWLAADGDVPDDALQRLEVDAGPGLHVLPAGAPTAAVVGRADRASALAAQLAIDPRPVVADCGGAADGAGRMLAAEAAVSLLVLRPCYLAVRRALAAPMCPSGVVLVTEHERALGARDIEDVLGTPVLTVVPVEPSIARAIDAGLLGRRMPRPLAAAAGDIVASLPHPVERRQGGSRQRPLLRRVRQR
ncbi:MAG: hypothetical protein M3Z84_03215 [Actinomycetota bacterium]|nr:hypothetical protein [Actinomycetota bacterium]